MKGYSHRPALQRVKESGRAKGIENSMDKKLKQQFLLVAFGVALYAALMNFGAVALFLRRIASLLTPVITGLLMAFVLSVPMLGIAKRLKRRMPQAKEKTIDALSLALTVLCVVVAVVLLCVLALPQLAASLGSIGALVKEHWPDWARSLSARGVDTSELTERIAALDWKTVIDRALTGAGALIGSVMDIAGTTVSAVMNVVFAAVIMFYVLTDRRNLARGAKRLLFAGLKEERAEYICRVARLTHDTYAKFLSGQCVEVVILGTMIFLAFTLCGIPYAGLTAALTAAFAFVPYVGALASCAIGVLLTLLAQPDKALLCLIVYQAVQFVENQFIYPHVVGGSVGLAPLWTLLAALLGGKLFGLVGIVFFIPLTAVALQLVQEHTARQLAEKHLAREDLNE